jgi:hypothetical protein
MNVQERADLAKDFQVCIEQKTEIFLHKRLGETYCVNPRAVGLEPKSRTAGGMVLMEARDINQDESNNFYHHVRIIFHGAKDCWMLENECVSPITMSKRSDHFGSLSDMMRVFNEITGIMPKPVTVHDLRFGSRVVEAGKPDKELKEDPWQLLPGATYSIQRSSGHSFRKELWQVALTKDHLGSIQMHRVEPPAEIYEPYSIAIFLPEELITLKLQKCAEITEWIDMNDVAVRFFSGTKNWAAYVENGPRVRISPYDFNNIIDEKLAWKWPEGMDLDLQDSMRWCDSQLTAMGYQVPGSAENQISRPRENQ